MRFDDLRLAEPLLRAVREAGYRTPTPIQTQAIPHVLAERDVLACAQTGTGKTAAFALPILHRLREHSVPAVESARQRVRFGVRHDRGRSMQFAERHAPALRPVHSGGGDFPARVRALVLCPTRELAQQIQDSFGRYGQHTGVRCVAIYGGVSQVSQVRALGAGVDVAIATPGRLLDLMGQRLLSVAGVEILVLDEADRMLDMGFLPDVRRILSHIPRPRQSLLFSATIPDVIRTLAGEILCDPVFIAVARVSAAAETVAHWVYHVERTEKPGLLIHLLARSPNARALVFTRTKRGADKLTRHLAGAGVRAAALHGDKSQGARTRALREFRAARTPVLVATDIAARGLDVDDIAQVINYDLTPDPETYVHRIGRTGRAGAAGTAVSFCSIEERAELRAIERLLRGSLQTATIPLGEACAEGVRRIRNAQSVDVGASSRRFNRRAWRGARRARASSPR
jgi:ATP-dependent RNA helicase RhlE